MCHGRFKRGGQSFHGNIITRTFIYGRMLDICIGRTFPDFNDECKQDNCPALEHLRRPERFNFLARSRLDSGICGKRPGSPGFGLDWLLCSRKKEVSTPFMANLDGFILTHTYEVVDVPTKEQAEEFLPPYETENKLDLDNPKNLAFTAGPDYNMQFKYKAHEGLLRAKEAVKEAEEKFEKIFGRKYTGLVENYYTEDADYVLVTLGSIAGVAKEIVKKRREKGEKVGLLKIRYLRPFPNEEIAAALKGAKAVAVFEKDISFGNEGTVYTNVLSALLKGGLSPKTSNYVGGLGGKNVSPEDIEKIFDDLKEEKEGVNFIGIGGVRH